MSSEHASHQIVKSFYEAFPYPALNGIGIGFDPHRRAMINYHASRCCTAPLRPGCRILVAGCGTCEALYWALCFPDSEVIGIDLSASSLDLARQCAGQLGLGNLTLRELDILDCASLPGGPFDLISAYGVLHHLADPAAGLAALKGVLAPAGLMHLMVYNTSNRYFVQAIQSLVTDLCRDPADVGERFEVAARLVRQLAGHSGNILQHVAQEALKELEQNKPHFMDTYAHPQEQSFTIKSLLAWLEQGGLRFAGWSKPRFWSPRRVIGDPDLLARLDRMPEERRDHFIDQTRHPLFEFYAESAAQPRRRRPCLDEDEMFWQRVPTSLAFGKYELVDGRLSGQKGFARPQHEYLPATGTAGAGNRVVRLWVDPANDITGHPILLRLLEAVDGQRTMEQAARAACAAEGIELEDVRATLKLMFQGLLDEAVCIDVDPEQCHACRRRSGLE